MIEPTGLGALWYVLTGVVAGLLGALLGLGGGILIVPILTLVLRLPVHMAVAASLVGVVATSVSSSAGYLKRGLPLVRLGLTLELSTLVGAVAASTLAGWLTGQVLEAAFSVLLFYTAWHMWKGRKVRPVEGDPEYLPATPLALLGSAGAGAISGALGVGGGVVKVPILNILLGAPIHRATSTSTFMMGLTAASGSVAYYLRGDLSLAVAAPLVLGVLIGGRIGPRLAVRLEAGPLRRIFVFVLLFVAIRMLWGVVT
jgi:uncharacterized membrane protein YfcA